MQSPVPCVGGVVSAASVIEWSMLESALSGEGGRVE